MKTLMQMNSQSAERFALKVDQCFLAILEISRKRRKLLSMAGFILEISQKLTKTEKFPLLIGLKACSNYLMANTLLPKSLNKFTTSHNGSIKHGSREFPPKIALLLLLFLIPIISTSFAPKKTLALTKH